MLPFSPAHLFIILLVILTAFLGYKLFSARKETQTPATEPHEEETFELLSFVEQLLTSMNCVFTHHEKEKWHEFSFKYQAGNFIIFCKNDDHLLRIHYPHFFSTKIDELGLIREICNNCNAQAFSHHVLYTTDGKENTLSLHITSSLCIVDRNEKYATHLSDLLSHFFNIAQEFYLEYEKGKERYKLVSPDDAEENYLKYEREFFMLREMEIKHQPGKAQLVAAPNAPLSISQILLNIYGWENPEFLELKVITHQMQTLVNESEIANFDISKVLIANNAEGEPNFAGRNATLILTFSYDKEQQQCFPQQMVIALANEGMSADSLYQRATLSMSPIEPENKNSIYTKDNIDRTLSFIFAFDKTPREQIEEKVNQTLQSLTEKLNQNNFSGLTSEEILTFTHENPDVECYLLHANRLFRQKRYYETVVELEYIFKYLSPRFLRLSQKEQNAFYEVCYYIGFSYDALGLYKQAYYYLDAVCPLNRLNYMEEYVNCMVNNKDFRALSIIENMETLVKNQVTDSEETLPEKLQYFLNFLKRRKAHHLIDLGFYDKAKELFQAMYQEPENQDYALNELAYLQKLSEKSHPDEETSSNPSDHNEN